MEFEGKILMEGNVTLKNYGIGKYATIDVGKFDDSEYTNLKQQDIKKKLKFTCKPQHNKFSK